MKNTHKTSLPRTATRALLAAALALVASAFPASAQTPGSTVISNTATATYKDTSNNDYETQSNTVTVTVANVSGLAITPDGQTNSGVVAGEADVKFVFTVTNTGNFTDQARFLASGASVHLTGPGTVTAAVIDNGDNQIGPGDTDIFGNGGAVDRSLDQNQSAVVIVHVTISGAANENDEVRVFLGDAPAGTNSDHDNQPVDDPNAPSAHEVRTVTAGTANGQREARGDIRAVVQNDVRLRAEMVNWPAGPVALGSDITYTTRLCNTGARDAAAMTLGGNSGIYVVVPVPASTQLSAANSFPAGTLYTTSLLNVAPESATWTNVAPPAAQTTRVAFYVGNTLASGGACSANFQFVVTITATNASTPIYQIVDAFAQNTVNAVLTDQSGDADTNQGDRNANFDEPAQGSPDVAGKGFMVVTLLEQSGNVLIGPQGNPGASGPGGNNTDFTERSVRLGIAGRPPGSTTNAQDSVTFVNTVQNTGNANDTFTLSAPTVPAGFTVEISTAGAGGPYTDVSSGGTTTLALNFGASADIHVRVTAPAGQAVLTGFATVIRATSGITNTNSNDTIDRLFTGFIRLTKSASTMDADGNPGPAVPGNHIEFVINYVNIMTAVAAGSGNSSLSAENLVITENGVPGGGNTNNWANFTTQVVGSASDVNNGPNAGQIAGDVLGSNVLTDTISSLPAGASGTFRFKRRIN
jgi:hypothetical protein